MHNKESMKEKALEFLRKQQTAAIATVTADGDPQSATVTYIIDNEFCLYFITRKSSRKFHNIKHNGKVGVVVGFNADHPMSVQLQGVAEVLPEKQILTMAKMIDGLMEHGTVLWPLLKTRGLDFVVIKITPTWVRWLSLDQGEHPESYQEEFYELIP